MSRSGSADEVSLRRGAEKNPASSVPLRTRTEYIARHRLMKLELDLGVTVEGAEINSPTRSTDGSSTVPILSVPVGWPRRSCAECARCRTALMICSASTSKRRPAGVSVMPEGVRSKSITPNCSSSVLIWLESAGWLK